MSQINKVTLLRTWMGDCPRYEAKPLGQLSLLPSVGW